MTILNARQNLLALSRKKNGLHINNFTPSTGIGKFDARYDITTNFLDISLKVHYIWDDGNQPELKWTLEQKQQYKEKLKQVVEGTWSECYTIASDKPELHDLYARVRVHIVEEPTIGASHYRIKVKNHYKSETLGSGINRSEMMGMFGRYDVEPEEKLNRDKSALSFKTQQVSNMLNASGANYLAFPPNSSNIPTEALLKLQSFASNARRVITKEMAESEFAIYVYGKTGASETGMNILTGKNRANKVADALRRYLNFKEIVKIVSSAKNENWILDPLRKIMRDKGFNPNDIGSRSFPGVVLLVKDPGQYGNNLTSGINRNYIVVAHEFGHMFGLPDEYFGVNCLNLERQVDLLTMVPEALRNLTRLRTDPREPGQAEGFAALIKESNVPSPIFMNSTREVTTSIMYAGSDVLPAHYLTFWEALLNCTFPYFRPSEWKIVPNARGEGKKSNLEFFAQ